MKNISKLILIVLVTGSIAACKSTHKTGTTDTTKVADSTKTNVVDTTRKSPMTTDTTKKDTTKKP